MYMFGSGVFFLLSFATNLASVLYIYMYVFSCTVYTCTYMYLHMYKCITFLPIYYMYMYMYMYANLYDMFILVYMYTLWEEWMHASAWLLKNWTDINLTPALCLQTSLSERPGEPGASLPQQSGLDPGE